MHRHALGALAAGALIGLSAYAQDYPKTHIVRGIYVPTTGLISTAIWAPYGVGPEPDSGQVHGGKLALRGVSPDAQSAAGASQMVAVNQKEPKPLEISGWSRAEGVEGPKSYKYSLYLDLVYQDGESWYMQLAQFEPGTHDWQVSRTIITPKKPVKSAAFHAFIREQKGTVWFDDLFFGEPGGKNLLRDPGFEGAADEDTTARDAVFGRLADLHINALHVYLGRSDVELNPRRPGPPPVSRFLQAAHQRGLGVWVTLGWPQPGIKSVQDPNFPEYYCVNGRFGREWPELLALAAKQPFDALGFVPDEYNWNTWGPREWYAKCPDEKVRQFYAALPPYCNCPDCRRQYQAMFGRDLPELSGPNQPQPSDPAWLDFCLFRYASTTDWIRRTADAVKAVRANARLDSMICVSPICSDDWLGPGVAWDDLGHHTKVDVLQTDPYLLLHNYLGDSTHWYITETATHLVGANRQRRAGVTLEASRLRPSTPQEPNRNHDPVEVYGCAYSAIFRGAREIFWWHYSHLTGEAKVVDDERPTQANVRNCYGLLERVDPWFARPPRPQRLAVLHSRLSEDFYRRYVEAKDQQVITHPTADPRYGHRAQQEFLYYLFREAIPFDLYYLEQVSAQELAPYDAVVVPFPFALSDDRAKLLTSLAQTGKKVLVISEFGRCDEQGRPRTRGALLDLLGLADDPSGSRLVRGQPPLMANEVEVYGSLRPAAAKVAVAGDGGAPIILSHSVGRGRVLFAAGPLGYGLVANRDNEKRTVAQRIQPNPLSADDVRLLTYALADLLGGPPSLIAEKPRGKDAEVNCLRSQDGGWLVLATNWENEPLRLVVRLADRGRARVAESFSQTPGGMTERPANEAVSLARWELSLSPQEARLVRLRAE